MDTVLRRAARAVFSRWTALRLAVNVSGQRSGNAIADELLEDVCALVTSRIKRPEVDDYLVLMEDAFDRLDTNVEDGSLTEVAHILVQIRDAAAHDNLQPAHDQINKAPVPAALSAVPQGLSNAISDSCSSNDESDCDERNATEHQMEVDALQPASESLVDEDGFQKVARMRPNTRRNIQL